MLATGSWDSTVKVGGGVAPGHVMKRGRRRTRGGVALGHVMKRGCGRIKRRRGTGSCDEEGVW